MNDSEEQSRDFAAVAAEAGRVAQLAAEASAAGLQLGRWIAASRHSAVFAVDQWHGNPTERGLLAKLPWLLAPPTNDHPDVTGTGDGPWSVGLVSCTGPFVLRGPATETEAIRLVLAPNRHQLDRGTGRPLPRVYDILTLASRPVVICEAVSGNHDLAWMIKYWPGRARRLLPRLAGAIAELHATYGPHGDLKPEHVLTDFNGTGPLILVDPLGPLTGEAVGSLGWQLPLPTIHGAHRGCEGLADLVALAQIVGACWGDPLPWGGRLAYALVNIFNGRFSCGVKPSELRTELVSQFRAVPEPWRAWALDVTDAFYALWEHWGDANVGARELRGASPAWQSDRLLAFASLPQWEGPDRDEEAVS